MPKLDAALIAFGKLIGLMDTTGTVQWAWFGDPLKNSLTGIPQNRELLGTMMRAMLDRPDASTNPAFDAANHLEWEPIKPVDSIGLGLVWNSTTTDPLHLGFGADAEFDVADQKLAIGLLARMLKFETSGQVSSEFGQFTFSASSPVPKSFLNAASLSGSFTDHLAFNLSAENSSGTTKTLTVPPTNTIPWDATRLAAFLVRSWVKAKAGDDAAKGFFYRMDQHFFPMLGDGTAAGPIHPLPPMDAMGTAPNFDDWKGSIFSTGGGASGALTFLWHLRALITGNENPNIWNGSSYFPLVSGGGVPAAFPPSSFPPSGNSYPPSPDAPGAWLGFRPGVALADPKELVLEFRAGHDNQVATVVIARFNNGTMERPSLPDGAAFDALTAVLGSLLPISFGANQVKQTTGLPAGKFGIDVFTATVNEPDVPALNGEYSFGFVLEKAQPIGYRFSTPIAGLTLPPTNAADVASELVAHLLQWLFSTVLSQAGHPMTSAVNALIGFVQSAIAGSTPGVQDILSAVVGLAGNAAKLTLADPLTIDIAPGGGITPNLTLGPIAPEALQDAGISIGSLTFGTTFELANLSSPIAGFHVSFTDVRLGANGGPQATGLVSSLFPDLRQVQGFNIEIDYKRGDTLPSVTGGGKIPIQRTIGPLEIVSLLIEFNKDSFTVGVDLFFSLGPIQVVVYELGITISYSAPPKLFLHGLGVSFDGGGIKLTGLFLEISHTNAPSDYLGFAVVSIVNLFELSAIGGYSTTADGDASLFIFASLVAPLGGPPWFFITGIAGGFGFNRNLPSPLLLGDHPFLQVMRGDISFDSKDPQASIQNLAASFAVAKGKYWIAAGIQFTCFAVINGKVVVAVSFGKGFSFNMLGMLSYGIQSIAYFELDFSMTADEEHFLLIAGMSPNSYLIDPSIFSLQGQFCMGVWYANEHAGDFVISIGGYHPVFKKPDYYPDLTRVGVKALVYNFIHVDVQCFFACTPQALMAGASVSLYAKFAGISAGLDVYIDVLIMWHPFYLFAELGVCVWFQFMGRHEIGVDLQIHTPPFGGTAHISIFVVSFTISFGDNLNDHKKLSLDQFLSAQLNAPATPAANSGAAVAAFNTASQAGLFRIDVTGGRASQPQEDSKKQEGVDTPIPVNPEFVFTVQTKLPIGEQGANETMNVPSQLNGFIDFPLCTQLADIPSVLTITAPQINQAKQRRMINLFPAAMFGDPLPEAQAGTSARDAIGGIDTTKPSLPMSEGIEVTYRATEQPPSSGYLAVTGSAASEEYSSMTGGEEFPLPIAWPRPEKQVFLGTKSAIRFADAVVTTKIKPKVTLRTASQIAVAMNAQRTTAPWQVVVSAGDVFRGTVQASAKTLTVAATATATTVSVPASPARRGELFPVALKFTAIQAPVPVQRLRLPVLVRALNVSRVALTSVVTEPVAAVQSVVANVASDAGNLAAAVLKQTPLVNKVVPDIHRVPVPIIPIPRRPDLSVLPGRAGHIELAGGRPGVAHNVTTAGTALLRMLSFDKGERLLEDRYVMGAQKLQTAAGARSILFLHEGTLAPVRQGLPSASLVARIAPGITENIGIESDTPAIALNARAFAGHACVVQTSMPLPSSPALFDAIPGAQLLLSLSHYTISFPVVQQGCTLILIVAPVVETPAPALEQIAWAAFNASLSNMLTLVTPDRTAFFSTIDALQPWQLEIDLGTDWRVQSVVVSPTASRELFQQLSVSPDWDLIDDRIQTGVQPAPIDITFEVTR